MNLRSGLCTLTNLSFGLFILVGTAISQESWAGGFSASRSVMSNNIYQCSTGLSWESVGGSSNIHGTFAGFSMGCFNRDGSARWLFKSLYQCEGRFCTGLGGKTYINTPYNKVTGTYTYNFPSAIAGVDCQLKKSSKNSYEWQCQKLIPYSQVIVNTVGNEERKYDRDFIGMSGIIPTIRYSIVANTARQAEILKSREYCQGSARFCNR